MINVSEVREGDLLRRLAHGSSHYAFTKDRLYEVKREPRRGMLFIEEDNGKIYDLDAVASNSSRWELVDEKPKSLGRIEIGAIEITYSSTGPEYTLEVVTDGTGFDVVNELAVKAKENSQRERRIKELERELAKLKSERETIE